MILTQDQIFQIQAGIQTAINRLYNDDNILLERRGMERSISFRLALYLNEEFEQIVWLGDVSLDMEYNKNGDGPKRTLRRPHGAQPDLILHHRGDNTRNILVIETKGWWNNETREVDYNKLEDFTNQLGEYKYGIGVFLELGRENCQQMFFINAFRQ